MADAEDIATDETENQGTEAQRPETEEAEGDASEA